MNPPPAITKETLERLRSLASETIPPRVSYYANLMGISYGRITIRAQKSRWGSCSAKGNLNFNCLLMLTPPEVQNYVIVHELCHRKQMNHSPAFWREVEQIMPEYRRHRLWLKKNGGALIRSMISQNEE
jgi:predicted metal-dependent hydrolase